MQDNPEQSLRLENSCHALRSLYAVSLRYDTVGRKANATPAMTDFALSITAATTIKHIENVLAFKLSEVSIPGVVLALSPFLTAQLSPATVSTVIPALPADIAKLLPYKVREPKLIPKMLFPHGKRFSVTLELLFHSAAYIGYAYFFNLSLPTEKNWQKAFRLRPSTTQNITGAYRRKTL